VRIRLCLSLARRFMRSRSLARSTAVMIATTAALIGLFITISAFTLSGQQVIERDLGRFSAQVDLGTVTGAVPGDNRVTKPIATAAERAGGRDPMVLLTSFSVRPTMPNPPLTVYLETNWAARPFPDRYTLAAGRWPASAGEVVLSEGLRDRLGAVGTLAVFSGNERFRIVGVAHDRFGAAARILAADGTWGALGSTTRRNFPTATATPTLYWNGGDTGQVVSAVVAAIGAATSEVVPEEALGQVSTGVRTRAGELALGRSSWLDRIPVAYQVPSVALPLLAVLTIFGLNGRRLRRTLRILRSIGMRGVHATVGVSVATTAWIMISTTVGGLVGVGLGAVSRPVAERFLAGPISPFPSLAAPLLRLAAVIAVSCLLAGVVLHLTQARAPVDQPSAPKPRSSSPTPSRPRATAVRRIAAGVAGCVAVVQIATLDTVPKAMFLAGSVGAVVLLFTPELLDTALRRLPGTDPANPAQPPATCQRPGPGGRGDRGAGRRTRGADRVADPSRHADQHCGGGRDAQCRSTPGGGSDTSRLPA